MSGRSHCSSSSNFDHVPLNPQRATTALIPSATPVGMRGPVLLPCCRVTLNRQQRIRSYKQTADQLSLSGVTIAIGSLLPAPDSRKGASWRSRPEIIVEASSSGCQVCGVLQG